MWRVAEATDDEAIVDLCLRLYAEDPGTGQVPAGNIRQTLAVLRREPWRGRALVLDIQSRIAGYALLISFWSNEFGGEVCMVDELFVVPEHRGRGYATSLFSDVTQGGLWPTPIAAMALCVTPGNVRARRLYEGLGFAAVGSFMVRRIP
jgi:GNAT superfamily N-acetyltransferase